MERKDNELYREVMALLGLIRGQNQYADTSSIREFNCELLDSLEAKCSGDKTEKIKIVKTLNKGVNGEDRPYRWSVSIWFEEATLFADCDIASAMDFETIEEAKENMNKVLEKLGFVGKDSEFHFVVSKFQFEDNDEKRN